MVKTLKIMLDYLAGPVWQECFDPVTKKFSTGIAVVDNDQELQKINDEIQDMYFSYYSFDCDGQSCYFDEERERADKGKMLSLLKKLRDRLDEINDGSFVVDDRETERVKNL